MSCPGKPPGRPPLPSGLHAFNSNHYGSSTRLRPVSLFDDVRLHRWTGGTPSTLEELEARYRRQAAGQSPDGRYGWLNWMLRRLEDGRLVGTVQATLSHPGAGGTEAELAWVIGSDHQGNGYGREGALAMAGWLRAHGVNRLTAHIHPQHAASIGVARALGLGATNEVAGDEVVWSNSGH